jgi:uncharacterized protein
MLIEFIVKNYRSIRNEQRLTMTSTALGELRETHTFVSGAVGVDPLLASAVIYGANAAGKSNVLSALRTMRQIVLGSANEKQAGEPMPVRPFLFDEAIFEPTMFEAVFVLDGVRYQYGFEASSTRVMDEWLFIFPDKRAQKIFSRTCNSDSDEYDWSFGPWLKGPKAQWKAATRPNSLFLSTATQLNSTQLQGVYDWFRSGIEMTTPHTLSPQETAGLLGQSNVKKLIVTFLQSADIGIQDIKVIERPTSEKIIDVIKMLLPDADESVITKNVFDVETKHIGKNGEDAWMSLSDESEGTQALFSQLGPFFTALANGKVLLCDELNNSLHPLLASQLVSLFHNKTTNPSHAQLIFTTHATSLLSNELFRRDQIWFAEKTKEGITTIYPLSDFEPRKDAALAKNYLQGRFGAIPFLRADILDLDGMSSLRESSNG